MTKHFDLDVAVEFGQVSIGDETGRLGFKVERSAIVIKTVEQYFAGRRLQGIVTLKRRDDEGQMRLAGMEDNEPPEIRSVFDVKQYSANSKRFSAGLTFSLESIDANKLASFAKKSGRLCCSVVGDLDEEDDGGPTDEDLHPDVAAGRDRPHGTPLLNATAGLQKKLQAPIDSIGLKPSHSKKLKEEANLSTAGELKRFREGGQLVPGVTPGLGQKACEAIETVLDDFFGTPKEVAQAEAAAANGNGKTVNNDSDWLCCDCGHRWQAEKSDECPKCEAAFGIERVGFHGDPNVNEHDVYVYGSETLKVEGMPEETVCELEIVQGVDGKWRSGYVIDLHDWRHSEPLKWDRPSHPSRSGVIEATVGTLIGRVSTADTEDKAKAEAAADALRSFSRESGKARK